MVWIGRAALLLLLVGAAVWLGRWLGPDWSWVPPLLAGMLFCPVLVDHWRRRDRDARDLRLRINGTGANGQERTH